MCYIYGKVHGSAIEIQMLHKERFPTRRVPDARTFQRQHQQLCEKHSLSSCTQDNERERSVKTPSLMDDIVHCIGERPKANTHAHVMSLPFPAMLCCVYRQIKE